MRTAAPATNRPAAAAIANDPAALKRCFPPVVDEHTRVIVLGSLPGDIALARGQYYGNPQNHFWRLMSAVIGADLVPIGYEQRLETLRRHRVGLWDTIASAHRDGALDTAIRGHIPNALPGLVASLPSLRAIGFNGKTSAKIGRKALGETELGLIDLPSSSPAYTAAFDSKREAWLKLRAFL
jgi:double-stranded uracil-DNA glycosylase